MRAGWPKVEWWLLGVGGRDPYVDNGGAYRDRGVVNSIRPASLGGKPEEGEA